MQRPKPLVIVRIPGRREAFVKLTFEALGKERADRIWSDVGPSYQGGGVNSPGFRTDYLCDLKASPGERIIPAWEDTYNVGKFDVERLSRYCLAWDFGGTQVSQTAVLAAYQLPHQLRVFLEYVPPPLATRIIKERLRFKLRGLLRWLPEDFDWSNHFDAPGDVTGVGYKLDYADLPWPLQIINASNDPNWRSRDANQSLLNGLCGIAKRCCYREFPDAAEKCDICLKPLVPAPGLLVHERCEKLIGQIPAAVRDERGIEDKGVQHDALDAMLYMSRWFQRTHAVVRRQEEDKRPWFARQEPLKPKGPLAGDAEALRIWTGRAASSWV